MVDYNELKKLREETGVSFSLCKKALEETANDVAKAKEKLKEWGKLRAKEKAGSVTSEGALFSYVHHNNKVASLVEIQCETDFVSKNNEFQQFGKEIAMQIASSRPKDVKALLAQEYNRDPSKKIEDLLKENVLKFGENLKIVRFARWELGGE